MAYRYKGDHKSEHEGHIHGDKLNGGYYPEGDITECTRLHETRILGLGVYDGGQWIKDNDNDQY